MNRREFCRKMSVVGGAVVLAPMVTACAPEILLSTSDPIPSDVPGPATLPSPEETNTPRPSATQPPREETNLATIALIKTQDRANGVRRALEMLNVNPVRGNHVLLKPNFNSADAAPGSTHSDVLRAMVTKLEDMGSRSITVGDRSGMGNTRQVMQQKGLFDLADELGFQTIVFDDLEESDWVLLQSGDYYWSNGYAVPKLLLETENVVQICNLKTHRYGGHFTLSLKNSVGFAAKTVNGTHDYMNELHNSPHQRQMIAEINSAYEPSLIVMDGVEAFVEGGPAIGKKLATEVVLAGTDRVAMDAVGVAILRMFGTTPEVGQGRIFELEQIARAVELGLGVDGSEKISIVTPDTDSEAYAAKVSEMLTA